MTEVTAQPANKKNKNKNKSKLAAVLKDDSNKLKSLLGPVNNTSDYTRLLKNKLTSNGIFKGHKIYDRFETFSEQFTEPLSESDLNNFLKENVGEFESAFDGNWE